MTVLDVQVTLPLNDFALDARFRSSGRVLGVFGPSGSGKSSLLEAIAGVRRARGRIALRDDVWLDGARAVPPERRGVGWVPQDGLLFSRLSVRENLCASRGPATEVESVARALGIDALLERDVETLSGGERQRVALGRALCSAPRLLLLDEPFGALELPLRRSLLPFLRDVTRRFDVPVVLVSHDPVDVEVLCDEVVVLDRGRVVRVGPPREVLTEMELRRLGVESGFDNLLSCRVLAATDRHSELELDGGTRLSGTAPRGGVVAGDETLVEIAARDVIVARGRPAGLSARNLLDATVVDLRVAGAEALLEAEFAGGGRLRVELTVDAIHALGLAVGESVVLVIKSTACRVHPASTAAQSSSRSRRISGTENSPPSRNSELRNGS